MSNEQVFFAKKFHPTELRCETVKLVELKPNGEIRYQVEIRPGHWVPRKVKAMKRIYMSFKSRYQITLFRQAARDARFAWYEGEIVDVELMFNESDFGYEEGEANQDTISWINNSVIDNNVRRIHLGVGFYNENWLFDGEHIVKSKPVSFQEIIPGKIRLATVYAKNIFRLKNEFLTPSEKGEGLSFTERDRVEVNIGSIDSPKWVAMPTVSKTTSGKRGATNKASFWRIVTGNKEFIKKTYVNLDFALKMHNMLGKEYGREASEKVDMFEICKEMGIFPFELDEAARQLVPYKIEHEGRVISGIEGIVFMAQILAERSSSELETKKLMAWAKLATQFGRFGVSHENRVKKLYAKEGEAMLNTGIKPSLFGRGDGVDGEFHLHDLDSLSLSPVGEDEV